MAVSNRVSDLVDVIDVCGAEAYIKEPALGTSEFGQLVDKGAVVVVLYPARPIGSPRRNDDLQSIRRHGPIELALAINIQSLGCLSALASRRRALIERRNVVLVLGLRLGNGHSVCGSRFAAVL